MTDLTYLDRQAVRVPYRNREGIETASRFRVSMSGDRFRWRKGAKLLKAGLYGLWRLHGKPPKRIILVEGESDCLTLWHHGYEALGLPGASSWQEPWAPELDGIAAIYLVIEPDSGGETVLKWLAGSSIASRARLVRLPVKDASDLHCDNPARFRERFDLALRESVSWNDQREIERQAERVASAEACRELASEPRILDALEEAAVRRGVVGESRTSKLLYLILTSRLLDRPVSATIKGPSSAGKSFVAQTILDFLPADAYYALSAMSERALAYSAEPLKHRHLVIYEAAGLAGDFASYLVRSLLSEGCIRYETVQKTADGMEAKLIEREGPTGLLLTTTRIRLHPENETRMLSVPVVDTPSQTRAVLLAQADGVEHVDLEPWHALQAWIAAGSCDVEVPFASQLADAVPPVSVRLRRDFMAVLSLVRAHALLHQATRDRDEHGSIVATLEDYKVVRELVGDLIAEGVEAGVSTETREAVAAVRDLAGDREAGVSVLDVGKLLKLDRSAASRRLAKARESGYVRNLEERKGKPARYVVGDPLPEELSILPDVGELATSAPVHACTRDGGGKGPLPPPRSFEEDGTASDVPHETWDPERGGAASGGEPWGGFAKKQPGLLEDEGDLPDGLEYIT